MTNSEAVNPELEINLFGPMQVRSHGQPVPSLRTRKLGWLLALLTLHHDRSLDRAWLAGKLWPDSEQETALRNLRARLSQLRSAMGSQSARLTSPDGETLMLQLGSPDVAVDVLDFDSQTAKGDLSALAEAVACYRGPLLEGCTEEWVFEERMSRELRCLQALQNLGDGALANGDFDRALLHYQRAVRMDPLWESAQRGLMLAHSQKGDTNEALRVYREFTDFLKSDPKAVPDEQTSRLYERLRAERGRQTRTRSSILPTATPASKVQGYLPHSTTELVGRDDDLLEIAAELRISRLVTLTGVGGIGKTRLAAQVAQDSARDYADGVRLVSLEFLSDGDLVIRQISSVLGLEDEQKRAPLHAVTDYLREKRLLLVLDNCEHLLEAASKAASYLLPECPHLRILATSREALGIAGEVVWTVPALSVPESEDLPKELEEFAAYDSVRLFVTRAQAKHELFALTEGNARMVGEVCRRLEGIPLAIELAAARLRSMSLEEIASRLYDQLSLSSEEDQTSRRQQTLRAIMDWSDALLSDSERRFIRRLSVFAGGCDLETAEVVCCGEGIEARHVLDLLTTLVDRSLVVFEAREQTAGRFRLLEMVRQYTAEGLQECSETELLRARHRDRFLALAEMAEPKVKGLEQMAWLQRLQMDRDNLRSALVYSRTDPGGAQKGLRLAGALHCFWSRRGEIDEGHAFLVGALAGDGAQAPTAARAKALNAAAGLAHELANYSNSRELAEEALVIHRTLGDKKGIALSLHNLGHIAVQQGVAELGAGLFEEGLALSREIGDLEGIANSLGGLGRVANYRGDDKAQLAFAEESLVLRRRLGDLAGMADLLQGLAIRANDRRDYPSARAYCEESMDINRSLANKRKIASLRLLLGLIEYCLFNFDLAHTQYEEGLVLTRELGDKSGVAFALYILGSMMRRQGDFVRARKTLEESLSMYREMGDYHAIHVLGALGHLERQAENYGAARDIYLESLRLRFEKRDTPSVTSSLEDLANLAARQGQLDRAVRLLGAAESLAATLGRKPPSAAPLDYAFALEKCRAGLDDEQFAAAFEAGLAMDQEQAVAYALEEAQ